MDLETRFNEQFRALEQNERLSNIKAMLTPPNPPDKYELMRLGEYYLNFKLNHRVNLLEGMFLLGSSVEEIVNAKLDAKGIDKKSINKRSLNCHRSWVIRKGKKAIILLIYLRYRIDEKLSRDEALKQMNHYKYDFGYNKSMDAGQSSIRKHTNNKKTEEKLNKL